MKKILTSKLNILRPKKVNDLKRYGDNKDGGYVLSKKAIKGIDHVISEDEKN